MKINWLFKRRRPRALLPTFRLSVIMRNKTTQKKGFKMGPFVRTRIVRLFYFFFFTKFCVYPYIETITCLHDSLWTEVGFACFIKYHHWGRTEPQFDKLWKPLYSKSLYIYYYLGLNRFIACRPRVSLLCRRRRRAFSSSRQQQLFFWWWTPWRWACSPCLWSTHI